VAGPPRRSALCEDGRVSRDPFPFLHLPIPGSFHGLLTASKLLQRQNSFSLGACFGAPLQTFSPVLRVGTMLVPAPTLGQTKGQDWPGGTRPVTNCELETHVFGEPGDDQCGKYPRSYAE
jgi:hypothetical protein